MNLVCPFSFRRIKTATGGLTYKVNKPHRVSCVLLGIKKSMIIPLPPHISTWNRYGGGAWGLWHALVGNQFIETKSTWLLLLKNAPCQVKFANFVVLFRFCVGNFEANCMKRFTWNVDINLISLSFKSPTQKRLTYRADTSHRESCFLLGIKTLITVDLHILI